MSSNDTSSSLFVSSRDVPGLTVVDAVYHSDTSILDFTKSGYGIQATISNMTDIPVFCQTSCGKLLTLNPDTSQTYDTDRAVCITVRETTPGINAPAKTRTISIPKQRLLSSRVIDIPELASVFSVHDDVKLMSDANRYSKSYCDGRISDALSDLASGTTSPVIVNANIHDVVDTDCLYVVVGNQISSVRISANRELPEKISVCINTLTGYTRYSIDYGVIRKGSDTDNPNVFELNINGRNWIMGLDRASVYKRWQEQLKKDAQKVSLDEVENRVSEQTKELRDRLDEYKDTVDRLKRELAIVTADLSVTKQELKKAEEPQVLSAAQERLLREQDIERNKLESLRIKTDAETESAVRRADHERVMAELAQQRELIKQDSDNRIAELKVAKESASVSAAHANFWSTALKTAVIAVPAALSLGYVLWGSASASAASSLLPSVGKALSSVGSIIHKGLSLATATCSSVISGIGSAISTVASGAMDVLSDVSTGVVETAGSLISSIGSGVLTVVEGAADTVGTVVSSVWDAGCSVVRGTWDCISSIGSGICDLLGF